MQAGSKVIRPGRVTMRSCGRAPMVALLWAGLAAGGVAHHMLPREALADTLTVQECATLAAARAPAVGVAAGARRAAAFDSQAVSHNRRPALSLGGRVTVAPLGYYDPVVTNLGDYEAKLAAQWPWLDGGDRARERARASLGASGAAQELAAAGRDAGRAAAAAALDLLRRRDQRLAQAGMREWLQRLVAELEQGVRAGSRGRADVTRARLELAGIDESSIATVEDSASIARELAMLLGRDASGAPAIAEPEALDETGPAAGDSLRLMERIERLPVVRAARIEQARARLELDEARRRNGVRVGVSAGAGLAGADLTSAVPRDLRDRNPDATFADRLRRDLGASVSVEVHRPLADPSAAASVAARERSLDAAARRADLEGASARREALDLLGRWRAARSRLSIAADAADRAEENLLRMRSLYAGGGIGLLDLLDARRQAGDAHDRFADARLDVRRARYEANLP